MVLTYKDNVVLFYDYKTFQLTYVHQWRYVGFGLTSNYNHDTNNLEEFVKHQEVWMTTGGTHLLSLELPPSFRFGPPMVKKAIPITFNGLRLRYVNEMDYNHETGTIYGNIWTSDFIVEVDPKTGICLHLWDLTPLKLQQPDNVDVMNGIACDSRSKGCLITGKFWPNIYNVDLLITATSARDVPSAFYHDYCTEFKAPSEQ
ncbi:Glutamine cyclotransferase family protein [Babesia bovis T2Bo]|uniref:Glutamine cyclotransferase, putative n=1 Tax=Babesia bovis TaxID=5865 RepID=A7AVX6_BABBO|nr:Glutamine cyclotransferase family protein [Babesia bovis T2Bo]EDO05952.1 Glutamine cyclotransferase family protein [Babesia bovis T2Bo]|eukprot:XP_001609520.1 glutamine cyclotransferase [Babesia bovis T2Bo]